MQDLSVPSIVTMPLPRLLAATLATASLGVVLPTGGDAAVHGTTLIALRSGASCTSAAALLGAGARLVAPEIRLWSVDTRTARRLVPVLRARGALAGAAPNRTYETASVSVVGTDPLSNDEWWGSEIGIDGLTPPGPGIPVTIVDSGVDFQHPEFAGRPNLLALNEQEPMPLGGEHGTAVASVIGAPVNGAGIVGIYPQAVLRSWDAAKGAGTRLDTIEIVNGILAAARAGRGVVNLSLGATTRDLSIELAVDEAVSLGTLMVAASGNDGEAGNALGYPAALPHVVTVAATNRSGGVASFSSQSPYVDIAAPGDDIVVASALGNDWRSSSGTSFSSPLVAGAAAWLWTVRPDLDRSQVSEILRRSARDIGPPGRDNASGFGMLNVAAALSYPAPTIDPREPNDDIDNVDPAGERYFSEGPSLTGRGRLKASIAARVDFYEDPRDVYRVWLPARKTIVATITSTTDNDLALIKSGAPTAVGSFVKDYRLARATSRGKTDRLTFANGVTGRSAYLVVTLPKGTKDASYRLVLDAR